MRIAVTNASGFIGREIIPHLKKSGVTLLLAGSDKGELKQLYPELSVTDYDKLVTKAAGFDALIYLTVMNNDQNGSYEAFHAANVEFLDNIVEIAKKARINTFISTVNLYVNDKGTDSAYARSKYNAEKLLAKVEGISVVNLRLPAVHGTTYKGKLALLLRLPKFLRPLAFKFLASLKSTVHAKYVARAILQAALDQQKGDLLVTDGQSGNWVYKIAKKALDLSFVFFVIVVLWWVLVLAWLAVKFTSQGPGIFAQQRVGKNGKLFTCYKFRTMSLGTRQAGTHEITADSVTKIGGFLRKTKIDELPQIWNILKNELSLIGPRPCLPNQVELIAERTKRGVFNEIGGITGWAQIKNVDMSDPVKLAKLDEEYLLLRTIILDIKIIIATATGHGQGDKVL